MDLDAILTLLKGKNTSALKSILSDENSKKALKNTINLQDAKTALQNAQKGDNSAAKDLLDKLTATPEGKTLIAKLLSSLGGNKNG